VPGEDPAHGRTREKSIVFKKNRKRRVIFNDDAYQQRTHLDRCYGITDEQSFIDARTTPTFDTHVDTYVWCVGNGAEPPWGPFGLKYRAPVYPVLGSPARATDLIVEACHGRKMEVWGSLRMNDVHDYGYDLKETNDPLKEQHPEYLIGKPEDRDLPPERVERYLRTAFNFERPEVRRHRLDFIRRNAQAHDFDGYELDFTRFIWTLPMGRERELAPLMTEFIREVRSALNAVGQKRGRPYTLVVHVMDSVEASLLLGLDVQAWVSQGLVDVLVVGMGYMPFTIDLDHWKALGERYGVSVYPSLNVRPLFRYHQGEKQQALNRGSSASDEYIRATADWWWHNEVDGIYLFNFFTRVDVTGLQKKQAYAPLKWIGDPAVLAGRDKLYAIEPVTFGGMFSQGSQRPQLPIALDTAERNLALSMGPDADDPRARFRILVFTRGGEPDTKVWMRLNHRLLEPVRRDGYYTVQVPAGVMWAGRNDFSICCNAELGKTPNPMIVHDEIMISVTH
jgi:hypothetical protein